MPKRPPSTPAAHHLNRARAAKAAGRPVEAAAAYRAVLRLEPANGAALVGLGALVEAAGDVAEAETLYRRALKARPPNLAAHMRLAQLQAQLGRLEEAVPLLEAYVALGGPESALAHRKLANIFRTLRRHEESQESYRRAVEADPAHVGAQLGAMGGKRTLCDWTDFDADDERLRRAVAAGEVVHPLLFMSTRAGMDEQLACARTWAARSLRPVELLPPPPPPSPGDRIRIGYLSGDFHDHATSYLTAALFEQHDRRRVEVFGYSYGRASDSPVRRRLEAGFDRFADIRPMTFQAAAAAIRADAIDVLVDLKGYTAGARSEILAMRPAAVQVNYLGFPGSMGADFVDYLIADAFTAPPEFDAWSVETIVRLPVCFQPNDSRPPPPAPATDRAAHGLPDNGVVFCALHNAYKLNPAMFDIWARLLQRAPGSVLWLLRKTPAVEANLRREAAARGIPDERLVFADHRPAAEHIERLRHADLLLDTLPVGAFTSASDALRAGLPIISCAGDTAAGRGAGSLLTASGLGELVAPNLAAYEALALALALDPARLAALKARVAERARASPVFQPSLLARALEDAYAAMVARRWGSNP